jgi:hypothetical protein
MPLSLVTALWGAGPVPERGAYARITRSSTAQQSPAPLRGAMLTLLGLAEAVVIEPTPAEPASAAVRKRL